MKSKRLIAFFRFFYDFLEICIRNILHLAFIEHRHQCHNNPFRRNPLDIIGQDASPTALPFPFRSNCHPDFIDALPKRSALERVFLQKTLISLISKHLRKKTARTKVPTKFYQSSLPPKEEHQNHGA